MSRDWREVMGVKKAEPLTSKDLAHLDALWAQSCLHDDDENAYLAGIGAMWPTLRPAVMWDIVNREHEPVGMDDEMCPNCVTPWKCNGPHEISSVPNTPDTQAAKPEAE